MFLLVVDTLDTMGISKFDLLRVSGGSGCSGRGNLEESGYAFVALFYIFIIVLSWLMHSRLRDTPWTSNPQRSK